MLREKTDRSIYMDRTFGHEDDLLRALHRKAVEEGVEAMQISPHEGRLLFFLSLAIRAEKIVEIGGLYNYSTVYLARALPSNGRVFTLDISKKRQESAQKILASQKEGQKIQWISGKALDTLKSIEPHGPFDMVFIDADKESYMDYLDFAGKNLRPGGLAAADNAFLFSAVYGGEMKGERHTQSTLDKMRRCNQRMSSSKLWEGAVIPTNDGLAVAVRKGL